MKLRSTGWKSERSWPLHGAGRASSERAKGWVERCVLKSRHQVKRPIFVFVVCRRREAPSVPLRTRPDCIISALDPTRASPSMPSEDALCGLRTSPCFGQVLDGPFFSSSPTTTSKRASRCSQPAMPARDRTRQRRCLDPSGASLRERSPPPLSVTPALFELTRLPSSALARAQSSSINHA